MTKPTNRRYCKRCGRSREEVGQMSWTGQCYDCGMAEMEENVIGLATMSGPARDRWRRAMAASVGAILIDEPPNGD